MEKNNFGKNKEVILLICITAFIIIATFLVSSYAFFNFTRTGDISSIGTGYINFSFDDGNSEISKGNVFPIEDEDVDNTVTKTFSLTGHTTYTQGIKYNIYVVYGDEVSGKTRLRDDVVSFQFIPAADSSGFKTELNSCSTPTSLTFTSAKALVSTGTIKDTSQLTTLSGYTIKLWIDSSKINISSTTKRATNAEGNPSLADATTGTTTATRYMRNNSNEPTTVKLYPARESQEGKIVYTTNEFENSFYSFRVLVEAEENRGTELVYLNANGGTVANTILTVIAGQNYPSLAQPTRTGYTFLGWNGKNLYNHDVDKLANVTYINPENTNISRYGIKLGILPAGPYTISYDLVDDEIPRYIYLLDKESDGTGDSIAYLTKTSVVIKNYSFVADGTSEYWIFCASGVTTQSVCRTYMQKLTDVQLERGSTATAYEPYYVDSTVTVTQTKDHALTAEWQKN